jgi:hypothetical protein
MYEFEAIAILALLFIIVYIFGSSRNRKLAKKYAKIIKECLSPYSEFIGFRAFGLSGFRCLSQLKKDERFSKIEIAVTLMDRENLMHYPLSLITHERDRLVCWAFLKRKPSCRIEILPKSNVKAIKKLPDDLKLVLIEKEFDEGFIIKSRFEDYPKRVFADNSIRQRMLGFKDYVMRVSIKDEDSMLHLIGYANEISIPKLINFLLGLGDRL